MSPIQLHKHGCPAPLKVPGIPPSLLLPFQAALICKSCVVPASHIQISQMPKAVENYIKHLLKQPHSSFNKKCVNRLLWFSLSSIRSSSDWLINYCNNNPFLTILRMFVSTSLVQNSHLWFYESFKKATKIPLKLIGLILSHLAVQTTTLYEVWSLGSSPHILGIINSFSSAAFTIFCFICYWYP